jgi:hypothetical protein
MSELDTVMNMAKSIGGQALASLYPNDFEWYMVALELADSDDNTIDYLTFPIMPDSISKTEPTRTNIKKSMAGVTVLSTPSYSPQEINIKGSFGRQFKILINPKSDVNSSSKSVSAGKYSLFDITKKSGLISGLAFSNFNLNVKTGYGVMKILQAMASKSVGLDDKGKPLRLYFYNMALGESYLVAIPPSGVQFSQDLSKNMIWNYNLTLIALAPLEAVSDKNDKLLLDKLLPSMIQTGVSEVASVVTDALQPVTETVLEGWL